MPKYRFAKLTKDEFQQIKDVHLTKRVKALHFATDTIATFLNLKEEILNTYKNDRSSCRIGNTLDFQQELQRFEIFMKQHFNVKLTLQETILLIILSITLENRTRSSVHQNQTRFQHVI